MVELQHFIGANNAGSAGDGWTKHLFFFEMEIYEYCKKYQDEQHIRSCLNFYTPRLPPFPSNPPFPPLPPPFPPQILSPQEAHLDWNHMINYIVLITAIVILIIISLSLFAANWFRCSRTSHHDQTHHTQEIQQNENNGIPMVTIIIDPDESSSIVSLKK